MEFFSNILCGAVTFKQIATQPGVKDNNGDYHCSSLPLPGSMTMTKEETTREMNFQNVINRSFEVIARNPLLRGLSAILVSGIEMFHHFVGHKQAAAAIREKFINVSWIFGDSWFGLVEFSERYGVEFPLEKVFKLCLLDSLSLT